MEHITLLQFIEVYKEGNAIAEGRGTKKRKRRGEEGTRMACRKEEELSDYSLAVREMQENKMHAGSAQDACGAVEPFFCVLQSSRMKRMR